MKDIFYWTHFPQNNSSSLEVRTTKIQLAAFYKEEKWYFQRTIFMLENCHVSVPTWVGFFSFLSTRLINPHHSLCTLIIKVTFVVRKGHSLRIHTGRSHSPTLTHWSHLDRFFESLPFLTEAIWLDYWDSCCIPTISFSKFVFNAHCGSQIPAMQFPFYSSAIFKKTQTKRHTLLIFKSESFPPPTLSSPTDKSTMYIVSVITMIFSFLSLLLPNSLPPNCPCCNNLLLLSSLITNTVKCPRAVSGANLLKMATEI